MHGFQVTPQGCLLDDYGRNLYVDTRDSRYGPGCRRENSFLAQRPNGAFCYGFYPHAGRPAGKGTQYRGTVIGPGVAPDVMWGAGTAGFLRRGEGEAGECPPAPVVRRSQRQRL